MLRHTITLNMARKMTSSFLGDDGAGHSNVSMSHDIPIRITEAAGQLGPAGAENSSFQSREDLIGQFVPEIVFDWYNVFHFVGPIIKLESTL